jgi:hypothetical protein
MEIHDRHSPRTLPLEPQGPERSAHTIELSAQASGTLVGAVVDDAFRTWLVGSGGHLTLVVWPGGFSACVDGRRFELLDEEGELVATGGEFIAIGGGFLVKQGDPRKLGHENVFITSARQVTRTSPAEIRPS